MSKNKVLADLSLRLDAETAELKKKLAEARGDINRHGKTVNSINKKITQSYKALGTVIAAAFAVKAIVNFTRAATQAADTQLKAEAKIAQAIKTTGGAAGKTAFELKRTASELQKITRFGDEEILGKVTAQLLTFTNVAGEQFDRAQVAALNLATVLDQDVKTIAIQLGKALNDPVKGIGALSRAGIQFTTEQKEVIKVLSETNRLAEAQTLILDELEKQYGGQAEAAAKAGTGGFVQFKNAIGDANEALGKLLLNKTGGGLLADQQSRVENLTEWLSFKTNPAIYMAEQAFGELSDAIDGATDEEKLSRYTQELSMHEKLVKSLQQQYLEMDKTANTRREKRNLKEDTAALYEDIKVSMTMVELLKAALGVLQPKTGEGDVVTPVGILEQLDIDVKALKEQLQSAGTVEEIQSISKKLEELNKKRKELLQVVPDVLTPKAFEVSAQEEKDIMADLNKEINQQFAELSENTKKHQDERTKATIKGARERFKAEDEGIRKTTDLVQQELDNLNSMFSDMVAGGVEDLANSIGEAIGGGEFDNVVKGFANTIGSFAQTFGSLLIAQGVAIEAFKKSLETLNPWVAIAAGIALVATGATIKAFTSRSAEKFADGGIVGGTHYVGDKVPAYVNSGEMILNKSQQAQLFKIANGQMNNTWGTASVKIGFDELEIALEKINKRKQYR